MKYVVFDIVNGWYQCDSVEELFTYGYIRDMHNSMVSSVIEGWNNWEVEVQSWMIDWHWGHGIDLQ